MQALISQMPTNIVTINSNTTKQQRARPSSSSLPPPGKKNQANYNMMIQKEKRRLRQLREFELYNAPERERRKQQRKERRRRRRERERKLIEQAIQQAIQQHVKHLRALGIVLPNNAVPKKPQNKPRSPNNTTTHTHTHHGVASNRHSAAIVQNMKPRTTNNAIIPPKVSAAEQKQAVLVDKAVNKVEDALEGKTKPSTMKRFFQHSLPTFLSKELSRRILIAFLILGGTYAAIHIGNKAINLTKRFGTEIAVPGGQHIMSAQQDTWTNITNWFAKWGLSKESQNYYFGSYFTSNNVRDISVLQSFLSNPRYAMPIYPLVNGANGISLANKSKIVPGSSLKDKEEFVIINEHILHKVTEYLNAFTKTGANITQVMNKEQLDFYRNVQNLLRKRVAFGEKALRKAKVI